MIEVEVDDMSFNEAIEYARNNIHTDIKYPDVILIANDIKVHQEGLKELFDRLNVRVQFYESINKNIEASTSIELNSKTYNKWIELCIVPFGTTYIVEKQVENEDSRN